MLLRQLSKQIFSVGFQIHTQAKLISFGNVHMAEFPGPVIDIPENKSMELLQMLQIKMSTNGTGLCCRKAQ